LADLPWPVILLWSSPAECQLLESREPSLSKQKEQTLPKGHKYSARSGLKQESPQLRFHTPILTNL
jgi:hypothetical protein